MRFLDLGATYSQSVLLLGIWSLVTASSSAADIEWDGSGTPPFGTNNTSWQNVDNWQPFDSGIFVVNRVPGDNDTATLSSPAAGSVELNANTAPIDGLTILNGMALDTNGFLLQVDDGGFAGAADTVISNAFLDVSNRPGGTAFVTDNLTLDNDGGLAVFGNVVVEGETNLSNSSQIFTESLNDIEINFTGNVTLVNSSIFQSLNPVVNFSDGITVSAKMNSSIELDTTRIGDGTRVELLSGSELLSRESTMIELGGVLDIVDGTFQSDGFINVDGGTFYQRPGSNFFLGDSKDFSAFNDAQITLSGSIQLTESQDFIVSAGADVQASNAILHVGSIGTGTSLSVRDSGSTFDIQGLIVGTASGIGTADLIVADDASGVTASLRTNANGQVFVSSGAQLEVNGLVQIGASGVNAGDTGIVFVSTGGVFTQTGSAPTQVGAISDVEGGINVSDGGSYTSNSQSFLVENTGVLLVRGGSAPGEMTINGQLTLKGLATVSSTPGVDLGGLFRATASTMIDGGTLELNGGKLIADSITFANSGMFDFGEGRLSVRVFGADLNVPAGGILAPGPTDELSGAGGTSILGNYTQTTGSTLEIEIGGTTMAIDFDFLDVADNAALGGNLMISLMEDFLPDSNDTFLIVNADSLLSTFDNVANGDRIATLDGGGSFQVNYGISSLFDPDQVVLSDFQAFSGVDTEPDGDIDGADFLTLQRDNPSLIGTWQVEYGSTPLPALSVQVPEPQPFFLAMLGTITIVATIRYQRTRSATPV